MKLSKVKKDEIYDELRKTYDKPFEAVYGSQTKLVKENYDLWIAPYEKDIEKLPISMINTTDRLIMEVYDEKDYKQNWDYNTDVKVPCMVDGSGWTSKSLPIPIDDSLLEKVNIVRKEEDLLQAERSDFTSYIQECLDKVTTTKQLRELWKDYPALSNAIPPEPSRKPKSKKQLELEIGTTLQVDALNRRLTMNILES
jgi:hypothetical protein